MQRRRTQATRTLVLQALRAGATRTAAAAHAGISRKTLWEWIGDSETFSNAVTLAEGQAELAMSTTVAQAARAGDWRAALEWLRRRRPDEWGDRVNLTVYVEELAAEFGLDRAEALRQAEAIIAGSHS